MWLVLSHAEQETPFADVSRAVCVYQQERHVPAVDDRELAGRRVEEHQAQGRGHAFVVTTQYLVDQARNRWQRVLFCDEGAQRVPEFPHYGRRVQRMPLDVADGDQDPVPPGQGLVEVTADLGLIARRQVAKSHGHARYRGQRRRQEAPLQS